MMSGVRELLDRFRPAAAPGAAGPAGVPADRRAAAATELEPVFAALVQVQTAAAAIRREGRDLAARERADAARQAQIIVTEARLRSGSQRADAAMQVHRAAQAELTEILASADQAAARVRDLGRQNVSRVRHGVVHLVRAEISGDRRAKDVAI
jgi:hypothetical protein